MWAAQLLTLSRIPLVLAFWIAVADAAVHYVRRGVWLARADARVNGSPPVARRVHLLWS